MKRFSETDKWTKDQWFSELEPRYKLFWLFLTDNCDNVGVWEVNPRMANFLIGFDYDMDDVIDRFGDKLHVFDDGNKWWIKGFINFQHGVLDPASTSKPILSYFSLLEKHSLYKEYTKGMDTLQGKGKGKGTGNGKGKGKEPENYTDDFLEWWALYRKGSKANAFKRWKQVRPPENIIELTENYLVYIKEVERPQKDGEGWLNGRFFETEWTHEAQGTKLSASQSATTRDTFEWS